MVAASVSSLEAATRHEIERWRRLGVAVLPGPRGQKGPRERGWTTLPHERAWELALTERTPNLVVRTGLAADGRQSLGAIDLDGKCPCGHNRAEHDSRRGCGVRDRDREAACDCDAYRGVAPELALARLLQVLPSRVAVSRTARGFHIIFWVASPAHDGPLPAFSADLFGGLSPHALQIPPSLHPSGAVYQWLREPTDDLAVVDLRALGLTAEPASGAPSLRSTRSSGLRPPPASEMRQQEFADLMARLGVQSRGRDDEFHLCPWHSEAEASLHVLWSAAIFHCFGCGKGGGLRRLGDLLGRVPPPTCDPLSDGDTGIRGGPQLGGSGVRAERDRLADALEAVGDAARAERMRDCREATWEAPDADLEAFACPNGDATPVRARMISCDDPQCPACMPWRLAADWRHHWDGRDSEGAFAVVRLQAAEPSSGFDDWTYGRRVRTKFREWHRARGLVGGFYGLTFRRAQHSWQAELLVVVGSGDLAQIGDGRAFRVLAVEEDLDATAVIRRFQQAYLAEAIAWETTEDLLAFRSLTRGRRRFQGFGTEFAKPARQTEVEEGAEETMESKPLHRISGGSGASSLRQPCCPRCGERLRSVGRFDPARMEMSMSEDGIWEWQWRRPPPISRHP